MQLNNIKRENSNKNSKRIGRGGKRGKTSGAGMKGQKARTGNSTRPELRDIIKKIPKLRGRGVNGNKNKSIINKYFAINVSQLDNIFSDNDVVNAKSLQTNNIIDMKKGKIIRAKILANGEITKKLTIEGLLISESAKAKIEKAGGVIK